MRLLIIISLFCSNSLFAQDITGFWEGTIYQEPGRTFYYDITIKHKSGVDYYGTTTIKDTTNGNYGMLEYTATFENGVFDFQETKIMKEDKTQKDGFWNSMTFYWCIKKGKLTYKMDDTGWMTLSGPWSSTGSCKPGTINAGMWVKPEIIPVEEESNCDQLKSADFLLGMWTGEFTQYSCSYNGTYPMILVIDQVDGLKFSGAFVWPASQFLTDARSRLEGEIKDGKIIMKEPEHISGDNLMLKGIYTSTLTDCDHMKGFWRMPFKPAGCTEKVTKKGGDYKLEHYEIPTIYFDHNSSELRKKSKQDLDEFAKFMKAFPNLKFAMDGHTDDTGSNAHNLILSRRRAQIVVDYLVSKGIKAKRFTYEYHAQSEPAVKNSNDKNRQLNRRTEISMIKK